MHAWIVMLAVFTTAVSCSAPGRDSPSAPTLASTHEAVITPTTQSFGAMIDELAPWPTSGDFPRTEWMAYVSTARVVQASDPAAFSLVLAAYDDELLRRDLIANAAGVDKLFLLMRVVFELPEAAPPSQFVNFRGSFGSQGAGDSVNLSWPVGWRDGIPTLIHGNEEFMGRYRPVAEYEYLRSRYPHRNLGQVREALDRQR